MNAQNKQRNFSLHPRVTLGQRFFSLAHIPHTYSPEKNKTCHFCRAYSCGLGRGKNVKYVAN